MKKLFIVFLIVNFSNLFAQILHVPSEYPSIQSAIDTSQHGDTVLVESGEYFEKINFNGKNIVVTSNYIFTKDSTTIENTIINGGDYGRVVTFDSEEDSTAQLLGFKIINGYSDNGGGIYLLNSNPSLSHLIICENIANYGGGLYLMNSSPKIYSLLIYKNSSYGFSIGNWGRSSAIHIYNSSPIINRTTITENDCIFYGKRSQEYNSKTQLLTDPSGIEVFGNSNPKIINSIIWNNYPNEVSGNIEIFYSNILNGWPGEGNIAFNPLFISSVSSNFSIYPNSPVIDKGISFFIYQGDTLSNIDNSNYLGLAPDMGYYEVEAAQLPVYFESITDGPIANDINASTGCNWIDINNDNFLDLFVTNFDEKNNLYINSGTGTFIKQENGSIVNDIEKSVGATWGDYNNDGFIDLFVVNDFQLNSFYENNGTGTFIKIMQTENVCSDTLSSCASWTDYNNDGYLDLFVGKGPDFITTQVAEDHRLYLNNGDQTFTQRTVPTYTYNSNSRNCTWGDIDLNGYSDLVISNGHYPWGAPNYVYYNFGNENLIGTTIGATKVTYGSSLADFNNDGLVDIFFSNSYYINPNIMMEPEHNELIINLGGNFNSLTNSPVVTDREYSSGSGWADFDNDGDLDLFVTDYQSNSVNSLYINDGIGSFTKINSAQIYGSIVTGLGENYSCSWGDFDNDGDLDLFTASRSGNNALYKNNSELFSSSNWISIKCIGQLSNKSAIGANVKLKATIYGNSYWQMQEVSSQTGHSSQNSLNVEFGLGDAEIIDMIIIKWPSEIIDTLTNIISNQFITVIEDTATATVINEDLPPINFELQQNYPNPFNPTTKIKFTIPAEVKGEMSKVQLKIYDILGNEIASLVDDPKPPGTYEVEFSGHSEEGQHLTSGIYFYKLSIGKYSETKKMLLMK